MEYNRNRASIILEKGLNHLEKLVLENGFSQQRYLTGYVFNATIATYDSQGIAEEGLIYIKLKATDRLNVLKNGNVSVSVRISQLKVWFVEPTPIFLVFFDAKNETAYWLDIKKYLTKNKLDFNKKYKAIHISPTNILNKETILYFQTIKNNMLGNIINN